MMSNALHLTVLMALLDLPLLIQGEGFFFFYWPFSAVEEVLRHSMWRKAMTELPVVPFFLVFVFWSFLRLDLTPTHCPNLQVNFSLLSELALLSVF